MRKFYQDLPPLAGVYLMYDAQGKILYIGKAKHLKRRVQQYFSGQDERPMLPYLLEKLADLRHIVLDTEQEALLLEAKLIHQHQPLYNVQLKEKKGYNYFCIDLSAEWPQLKLLQQKEKKKERIYFGPYSNHHAARKNFSLLRSLFPIRRCSDAELKRRKRPCLLHSIGRCLAPCVDACTKKDYDEQVQACIHFLKGKDKSLLKKLHKMREGASEKMDFERAQDILDKISDLEKLSQKRAVFLGEKSNCDALALFREGANGLILRTPIRQGDFGEMDIQTFHDPLGDEAGIWESFLLNYSKQKNIPPEILLPFDLPTAKLFESIFQKEGHRVKILYPQAGKKRALVALAAKNAEQQFRQVRRKKPLVDSLFSLQEECGLSYYPERIECCDVSHLAGSSIVASIVSFNKGEKDTKEYRRYKLSEQHRGNDCSAIEELLMRRYTKLKKRPHLLLIDGALAQLQTAIKVFAKLGIEDVDLLALSKEKGKHNRSLVEEKAYHMNNPQGFVPTQEVLFGLQNMRDEAHRFALAYQRKRRSMQRAPR